MDFIYTHNLNPILFSLGPLRVGWYGLMYAVGILIGYFMGMRTAKASFSPIPPQEVPNLVTYIIIGVIAGGRLGWVLFYGGMPYFTAPWRILETWKGGMSFHGGLIGVILAFFLYAHRHRISSIQLADFCVPWIALALFFGRLGNFINGELYGKPTGGGWGVVFPSDPLALPRHPSQLYEAFFEGILIFAILMLLRLTGYRRGLQTAVFLLLYGLGRSAMEFIRLPDAHLGYLFGVITMGQLLSLPMLALGAGWVVHIFLKQASSAPAPKRG